MKCIFYFAFQAPKEYLSETTVRESPDGLFTSIRLLTFKVTSDHFWNSQMRLICEAIIPQVQTLRSEEILISEKSILRTIYGLYGKFVKQDFICTA